MFARFRLRHLLNLRSQRTLVVQQLDGPLSACGNAVEQVVLQSANRIEATKIRSHSVSTIASTALQQKHENTENVFHLRADRTLDAIHDAVEVWADDMDLRDLDITYEMSVLTLSFGTKGTFVLNKQAPAQELWMSSPVSGPAHYTYCSQNQAWKDTRNDEELLPRFEQELQQISACTGLSLADANKK